VRRRDVSVSTATTSPQIGPGLPCLPAGNRERSVWCEVELLLVEFAADVRSQVTRLLTARIRVRMRESLGCHHAQVQAQAVRA
jgi:hypothetical protein